MRVADLLMCHNVFLNIVESLTLPLFSLTSSGLRRRRREEEEEEEEESLANSHIWKRENENYGGRFWGDKITEEEGKRLISTLFSGGKRN